MPDELPHTTQVQMLVERLRAGDGTAPNELILAVCDQLERLTRKMLRGNPRVRRWAQTDDVLQTALMRLLGSLQTVTPPSMRVFYGLASQHIRRELIDLARHYYGPEGSGAHHASRAGDDSTPGPEAFPGDKSTDPARLAEWTEFHRQIDSLPDKEREVFDLLYYQGQSQKAAAALLQVDVSTVQRRWLSAQVKLRKMLQGQIPGE